MSKNTIPLKPLRFRGTSRTDLQDLPGEVQFTAGRELLLVQQGAMPADWKPMATVGHGAAEIRIRYQGAFRVIFVAKFEDAIYVLHCFQKKTRKTADHDIKVAKARYDELVKEIRQ